MKIRDRVTFQFSRALLWQLGMGGLCALSLILLAVLWLSGARDTREAMADGRRLLIALDSGAIEGKQTSLENGPLPDTHPGTAATSPAAATAPATAPAAATTPAAATPPATAPDKKPAEHPAEGAASPPATTVADQTEPFADSDNPIAPGTQIKPAAVPLAAVKEELLEKTPQGNLPMIGPKELKPWKYYAKSYLHKGHLPTIAIIVTGLGENHLASDAALRLPENVSLSFSPYAKDLTSWAQAARTAGHEIMLDLPLEPTNYPASDPGPEGLLAGKGVEENNKRLKWLMSRTEGYIGFTCPPNEAFSSNATAFKDLLDQLNGRGLMIAMAREPAKTQTIKALDESKEPYIIADAIIDEDLSVTAIQARLLTLEKVASKRGFAVGLAQAFPLTMEQLAAWSADLEKNGFSLVPVTFITKLKFPNS